MKYLTNLNEVVEITITFHQSKPRGLYQVEEKLLGTNLITYSCTQFNRDDAKQCVFERTRKYTRIK